MNLALLSPWQQLFWLVCAVLLIMPLITFGVITIIRGYFRAKEDHLAKNATAIAKALATALEGPLEKLKKEIAKKEEVTENKE